MRLTVNFSLKKLKSRADGKCPVYVRCTMNNQRFELSSSIFICPESWDDMRKQVVGRSEETKILNNQLNKISNRVQDVYSQLESRGEPFSTVNVKDKLLGISNDKGVLKILDIIIKGIEFGSGMIILKEHLSITKQPEKGFSNFLKRDLAGMTLVFHW